MNQIRTFIAVDLPQPVLDTIEKDFFRLQKILSKDLIRWVSIENIHLTLKFLGNTPTTHIDFLKQILLHVADSHAAFDLQIQSIGSFPSLKLPRVIWLGILTSAALTSLQKEVDGAVTKLGYEKEARAFSAHLTLGRVKQNIQSSDLQKIRSALETFQLGKIPLAKVDSLHLYQSDLHANGSLYTKLFSVMLKR
ncbi:MAG: 2'-5' RNA ligase [Chloroflexi bacterium OLB14]|nr:MAG: 2'-5' RNA ligase [Chloroflexi bacterium OLB14]